MAVLTVKMPDDFTNKVSRLAEMTDTVIERALEAGSKIVLSQVKGNLSAAIGSGTKYPSESTGELLGSLGVSPVKVDNSGVSNLKVGFNEPRRNQGGGKGKRSYKVRTNAMVANVLEHGRHNQPPRPFMAPARAASRSPCIAAMKVEIEAAVNSL